MCLYEVDIMIDRYTLPQMKSLWSLKHKYEVWAEVEKAIAYAWYKVGIIPEKAYHNISSFSHINVEAIEKIEEKTKHDLIAFITYMEQELGEYGRFVHFGCTSSDIVDTSNALLLQKAGRELLSALQLYMEQLVCCIEKTRGLITIGRTHGIHAEPTTYALKFASFYAEAIRNYQRMERAIENISFGKVSGAVGTYAFLTPQVEEIACTYLGLQSDPVSTQIIQRDRYAEFFTTIAVIAGSIERLCVELRHLQRTELGEVAESFSKGQKGSSAMPHKKNPISAENITGLCRVLRGNALISLENMALWHERDISHSSAERVIMPDSTILLHYVLHRMQGVLKHLVIDTRAIERTLHASFGLFFSQRVLTTLIEKGMQRQKAYECVQNYAIQAYEQQRYFPDIISNALDIKEYLSKEEIKELFNIQFYVRYEKDILARLGL